MAALIAFISGLFARFIASSVVRFIAYKALLLFLFVVILPAVLLKLWFYIHTYLLTFISSYLADYIPDGFFTGSGIVEITGVAAHIAGLLNLAQGVTILVSCAFAGWIVRLIRG
jgi:hypothetical protein